MSKRSAVSRRMPVGQEPIGATIDHSCRHCAGLRSNEGPPRPPHEYLFHEGRSKSSPTASRYTCLICNTEMILERMGTLAGWT